MDQNSNRFMCWISKEWQITSNVSSFTLCWKFQFQYSSSNLKFQFSSVNSNNSRKFQKHFWENSRKFPRKFPIFGKFPGWIPILYLKCIWVIYQIGVEMRSGLKPSTKGVPYNFYQMWPQILCSISILTILTHFRPFLDRFIPLNSSSEYQ